MADSYSVKLSVEYETLIKLKEDLAKAKEALDKLVIGTVEFAKQEAVVSGLNSAIKNYSNLTRQQAQEMEAVWKALDKMNAAGQKEADTQVKILQARQKNIESAVKYSQIQMSQVNPSIQGTTQASSNAAMALLNLNYVVRDSPYFFQNFALGILAVGNNLNPLIDSFARLRKEALEKNLTTVGLLRQALVGGAGISIAFSLVVTAIQAFVFWQAKAKTATDETNKSLKDQFNKLEELSRVGLVKTKTELLRDIMSLEDEMLNRLSPEGKEATLEYRGRAESLRILFETNPKDMERLNILKDQVAYVDILLEGNVSIRKIDNEITALKERQKDETKEQSLLTAESIKNLEKMKNAFLGVEEKVKKIKESWKAQPPLLKEIVELMKQYNAQLATMQMGGSAAGTSGGGLRPGGGTQPLTNPFEGTLRDIKKQLDEEFKPIMQAISEIANTAGNAIANAFLSGKNAIDAATQALLQFITQLLVVQALKGILTAIFVPGGTFISGFLDFLGGFAQGGIIPKAQNGMVVGGSSYSGDRMLIAANSGEMILNATQQAKLFNMINNGTTIRVEGNLRAESNEFIAGFNKAVNIYNKNVKGKNIGR